MGDRREPWQPADWTVSPAGHLLGWMNEHPDDDWVREPAPEHAALLEDVMMRRELNEEHCSMLAYLTGTTEAFWAGAEATYRRDLARGCTETQIDHA